MLPLHPTHARIINGTMWRGVQKQPLTVDKLRNVICLAYPDIEDQGDDERSGRPVSYQAAGVQPIWWMADENEVDFRKRETRWYLADWEVESYECI